MNQPSANHEKEGASSHGLIAGIDAARLTAGSAKKLLGIGAGISLLGLVLAAAAFVTDREHFAFSYLTGFTFVLTIGLGGLFFVVLQHLVRAGWSVAARRQMEWIAGILPILILLFIPIVLLAPTIFHEWMGPDALHDTLLQKKSGYLNPTFFFIRAGVFFVVWTALSMFFRRNSLKQDETGDVALTVRMQRMAAPSMFLFAFSLTFAAFDWLMSLNPHWYSTIFGVYIFAGSVTSSFSLLAILTIALQKAGLFKRVSTIEHLHDIGKLLFGFTVFWAYIAFSQFFLIWYANIPEETIFFRDRWVGDWKMVSLLLVFGHFWVPFFGLLSRTAKRTYLIFAIFAGWHLAMHYVDMYWLVMPNLDIEGPVFSWINLAGLVLPVGALVAWIGYCALKEPVYPLKDPRLAETMKVENL